MKEAPAPFAPLAAPRGGAVAGAIPDSTLGGISESDARAVLEAFLGAQTSACALCFSTLHGVGQCPRVWTTVVATLQASGAWNEGELTKTRTAAVAQVGAVFAGVTGYIDVQEWQRTLTTPQAILRRAGYGIRMMQGLEPVPQEFAAHKAALPAGRGGRGSRGRGRASYPRGGGRSTAH